jgi:hypothetical protein
MADQGRWFKLWCSAPADDSIQELSPAMRWAWAALGCYTKAHGTRGRLVVSPTNLVLAAEMGVPVESLHGVIRLLPHVHVEEGKSVNGTITVTWQNWTKYQEDSTVAERQKTSRAKRRREEKRGEETSPPLPPRGNSEGSHAPMAGSAGKLPRRSPEPGEGGPRGHNGPPPSIPGWELGCPIVSGTGLRWPRLGRS